MEIGFRRESEAALFNDSSQLRRKYGKDCAERIEARLAQIDAAPSLAALAKLPQARLHQLVGNRDEQFSLDLKHPLRLIVEVADDPVPRLADNGIDRQQVTRLAFVEITDTH
ncbi:type II toxin-antitoxin system RelE/ParE family toxin [Demequina globuliformis]|uniref:type II toxin-antitoxin system RelE/ParE family toxin n=1 Tax=Demequina globuliformis TaxID=676202 RepID=UPI000782D82F|nr:type II toxin-antitoxin system RelE/ParE family toxin [Demequina globuliformis]